MTINLNTGSVQTPSPQYLESGMTYDGGVLTEYNDTTASEAVVYPSEHRKLLVVEPKTMIVVTGYNLDSNTTVKFRKVLRSNGVPIQGTGGCCPTMTISHSIRLYSTELPCWVLDNSCPIFVIKTPGCYELDVNGDAIDVVVTAMSFPMQEVNECRQIMNKTTTSDGA